MLGNEFTLVRIRSVVNTPFRVVTLFVILFLVVIIIINSV